MSLYYVTAGEDPSFLTNYTLHSIRSLYETGIDPDKIHICVGSKTSRNLCKLKLPSSIKNIHKVKVDLSHVRWTYDGGKRKYSLFKIAALHEVFGRAVPRSTMVYFDGDVLWFKNPNEWLERRAHKTWFHHGKEYKIKARLPRDKVDTKDYKSLSKWVPDVTAYLLLKYGAKRFPVRELVAGFYILHPMVQSEVLRLTHKFTQEISRTPQFNRSSGAGDQKPMNAALNILNINYHGGSRFDCLDHSKYFIHYFGTQQMKAAFRKQLNTMGCLK